MLTTRIGIIGTRGFGVIYSGFETLVSQLVKESADNYFYVLFSREGYKGKRVDTSNARNIILPTLKNKYFETPLYAFISTVYSLFLPLDTVLYLSVANTPFLLMQKLRKRKIIVNVDGFDWKRTRWSFIGRAYLKLFEAICVKTADIIIADSKSVYNYYKKTHQLNNIVHITYGANVTIRKPGTTLKRYKLKKNNYFLFVGRFVPENMVEEVIIAFRKLETDHKLVIVGDAFFENNYKKKIINLSNSDKRVILTGILEGKDYEEICSNAFCYVETKTVGGVHTSLLEAMAFGNCIIAKNLPEHREALSNTALYYKVNNPVQSLRQKMRYVIFNRDKRNQLANSARRRVNEKYQWKNIVNEYENLFI